MKVRIQKQDVPAPIVERAERVFSFYCAETGRTRLRAWTAAGDPSDSLRAVIKRAAEHPDLSEEELTGIVVNVLRNPPGWCDGRVPNLTDIFGPRAFDHALGNDGLPVKRPATNGDIIRGLFAARGEAPPSAGISVDGAPVTPYPDAMDGTAEEV